MAFSHTTIKCVQRAGEREITEHPVLLAPGYVLPMKYSVAYYAAT